MFDGIFRRNSRSLESAKRNHQNVYEEECQRLIDIVEHLSAQRKETIDVIRSVNSGINELISLLQQNNPDPPVETNQMTASQLISSIAERLSVSGVDHTDGLDYQYDYFENEDTFNNSKNAKLSDDGLKTELVILQSQVNRLRTEQAKLTNSLEEKDKEKEKIQKSHTRRRSKVFVDEYE